MRRTVIGIILLMVTISVFAGKDAFVPYLIDLKGWEAENAEGMSMEMGGVKMVSATREYSNGDKRLTAMIMLSNKEVAQDGFPDGMQIETSDGKMKTKKIDNFDAVYFADSDNKEQEGTMVIVLMKTESETAMMSVNFRGIDENEAIELIKQFDLKKIKKKAQSL